MCIPFVTKQHCFREKNVFPVGTSVQRLYLRTKLSNYISTLTYQARSVLSVKYLVNPASIVDSPLWARDSSAFCCLNLGMGVLRTTWPNCCWVSSTDSQAHAVCNKAAFAVHGYSVPFWHFPSKKWTHAVEHVFFHLIFEKKNAHFSPLTSKKKNMIDFFFSRTSFPQKVECGLLFHWAIHSLQFTEHRPKVVGLHVDGPRARITTHQFKI